MYHVTSSYSKMRTKAPELFAKSAHIYVNYAEAEIEKHFNFIRKIKADDLADYRL